MDDNLPIIQTEYLGNIYDPDTQGGYYLLNKDFSVYTGYNIDGIETPFGYLEPNNYMIHNLRNNVITQVAYRSIHDKLMLKYPDEYEPEFMDHIIAINEKYLVIDTDLEGAIIIYNWIDDIVYLTRDFTIMGEADPEAYMKLTITAIVDDIMYTVTESRTTSKDRDTTIITEYSIVEGTRRVIRYHQGWEQSYSGSITSVISPMYPGADVLICYSPVYNEEVVVEELYTSKELIIFNNVDFNHGYICLNENLAVFGTRLYLNGSFYQLDLKYIMPGRDMLELLANDMTDRLGDPDYILVSAFLDHSALHIIYIHDVNNSGYYHYIADISMLLSRRKSARK